MKKRIYLALLACLIAITPAYAVSINTEVLGQGKFDVGTETNIILDKEIESEVLGVSGNSDVDLNEYLISGRYGITDSITAIVKAGVTDVEVEDLADFEAEPSVGAGLYALLAEVSGWSFVGGGQFFTIIDPDAEDSGVHYEGEWKEWQLSLVASRPVTVFNKAVKAYTGLVVSDVDADVEAAGITADGQANRNVGVVIGASTRIGSVDVGLQGRVIDETSISVLASYRF